jgi:hypothetical protein
MNQKNGDPLRFLKRKKNTTPSHSDRLSSKTDILPLDITSSLASSKLQETVMLK